MGLLLVPRILIDGAVVDVSEFGSHAHTKQSVDHGGGFRRRTCDERGNVSVSDQTDEVGYFLSNQ